MFWQNRRMPASTAMTAIMRNSVSRRIAFFMRDRAAYRHCNRLRFHGRVRAKRQQTVQRQAEDGKPVCKQTESGRHSIKERFGELYQLPAKALECESGEINSSAAGKAVLTPSFIYDDCHGIG